MATSAEMTQMDRAATELQRVRTRAMQWAADKQGGIFADYLLTDAERAAVKNVGDTDDMAAEWLSTWRVWAERNRDNTGASYPVSFYLRVGKDLADAFDFHVKAGVNASAFKAVADAVSASAGDVVGGVTRTGQAATNLLGAAEGLTKALNQPWPTWVKVALGVGGLCVGVVAVGTVASAAKGALP
jgi:hypothetical protein